MVSNWHLERKDESQQQLELSDTKLSLLKQYVEIADKGGRRKMFLRDRIVFFRYKKMLKREEKFNTLLKRHHRGIYKEGLYSPVEALSNTSKMLWLASIDMLDAAAGSAFDMVVDGHANNRISSAPGSLMLNISSFLYSPRINERIFQQLVNDMRDEYFSALQSGHPWKTKWIRLRYGSAFVNTIGLSCCIKFLDKVISIWKGLS